MKYIILTITAFIFTACEFEAPMMASVDASNDHPIDSRLSTEYETCRSLSETYMVIGNGCMDNAYVNICGKYGFNVECN